jgi:hypothetical protein
MVGRALIVGEGVGATDGLHASTYEIASGLQMPVLPHTSQLSVSRPLPTTPSQPVVLASLHTAHAMLSGTVADAFVLFGSNASSQVSNVLSLAAKGTLRAVVQCEVPAKM